MDTEIVRLEREIYELKQKRSQARREAAPESVQDYLLRGPGESAVSLGSLFGDGKDLVVIHNMGQGCNYCTLWADGINGQLPHLEDRAALVVVSPDDPDTQARFAASRGWRFRMLSSQGSSFSKDMGFEIDGQSQPGVSAFRKDDNGAIFRVNSTPFGPGDDFCLVWPLFDLLTNGADNWEPQLRY